MKRVYVFIFTILALTKPTYAMHISEGYLPPGISIAWWVFYLIFAFYGIRKIEAVEKNLEKKMIIALVGGFVFLISALKIPSITGSSSHATGIALGALLLGVETMYVIGGFVLLFQAILLAHGGITTLGANAMSMAVVGSIVSVLIYKIFLKYKKENVGIFLAAFFGNLATYAFTAVQLATAHGKDGVLESFIRIFSLFSITQIPLGVVEGILTLMVIKLLKKENFIGIEAKGVTNE